MAAAGITVASGFAFLDAPRWHDDRFWFSDFYTHQVCSAREDGTGLTRVTYSPDFDGFPMFTRDGKTLVFASNRNGQKPHETNIFVADWVRK